METSREDVGIAIRSAFLQKGTQQRFSLFALIILSLFFLFIENIETKPLKYLRSIIKDTIYRTSSIVLYPSKGFKYTFNTIDQHFELYESYKELKVENEQLKNNILKTDYLELENNQLRKLIEDQIDSSTNLVSSKVMLDKQSPYLNSFVLNTGSNKKIKNGMAVLDGKNFIGRIVDTNFFSSRVLLVSDLNSKIPVVIQPAGNQAILNGHGSKKPTLEFLPENHNLEDGNKVYTSGKDGIFSPGIPIGQVKIDNDVIYVSLFSDLNQINFVNIVLVDSLKDK